jgi:acylphosphatase
MADLCIHGFVSGRVQGVWYRDTTRKKATQLGLKGWVKNLADGRVEVFACGMPDTIEAFKNWLWKGSPLSQVGQVDVQNVPYQTFEQFDIIY